MGTDLLITLEIPTEEFPAGEESAEHGSQELPLTSINLMSGSKLFVVGPNGSGKSALMNHWIMRHVDNIKIIRAHRNNCMSPGGIVLSVEQRLRNERDYMSFQKQLASRYIDHNAQLVVNIGLFDLIASENSFGISAIKAINKNFPNQNEKLINLEEEFNEQKSTIGKLNNILKQGSLNIQISLSDNQQIQASKNGNTFEALKLSDGERNALILSCQILCAPKGTIFFIDEPEQHLHRAIASPLLSALISEMENCAFVIFTHEISLVETIGEAEVLVLHGCSWEGEKPTVWDCNLLNPDENIPNNIRQAILGGRKKIIFVEGENTSLDRRLYEVMYPNFTIQSAGSCAGVIRAVRGLKESTNLHWVKAYGIIDHDGRSEDNIKKLKNDGIFALREFSIESLFYGQEARNIIAHNKARELGKNAHDLLADVEEKIVSVLSNQCERLAIRRCSPEAPQEDIKKEECLLKKHLKEKNFNALMARYPVRETGLLKEIAKIFSYPTCREYEMAVGECVINDKEFRNSLKSKLPKIVGVTG